MIALDTETTGKDFHHESRPYFVTVCTEKGDLLNWEWDVDPLTRQVQFNSTDVDEIQDLIQSEDRIVFHNSLFDIEALESIPGWRIEWPWHKTEDTLIASHLLASLLSHDLTSLVMQYLAEDIAHYEKRVEKITQKARRWCRTYLPDWRIAKEKMEGSPSASAKVWKMDMWLPRAVIKSGQEIEDEDEWLIALEDYANVDSTSTYQLWYALEERIIERNLDKIYKVRKQALPVAHAMKQRGITLNQEVLEETIQEFRAESQRCERVCLSIARRRDYDLHLPKTGNNHSLMRFCFGDLANGPIRPASEMEEVEGDPLNLPVVKWTGKGNPSLDKSAVEEYLFTLPPRSTERAFVRALAEKRKRDTAITYMEGYKRFWLPCEWAGEGWFTLHPSLNLTGTATLRWSSSNPNEQNISKKEELNLRKLFGPAPGREWYSFDAKNIELRIPFYFSGEEELIALFEKPDDPPFYGSSHLLNFSIIYPDIWEKELRSVGIEKVGPYCKDKYKATYYQWCKNGNFAIQYGAGEKKADATFRRPGAFKKLKQRFSKLERLTQQCIRDAERFGYVETFPDKTVDPKHGYPVMTKRTEKGTVLPTVPLNYKVQSTAMWWTKKAMLRVHALLTNHYQNRKEKGYLIMQVHDEVVVDLPASETDPLQYKNWKPGTGKVSFGAMRTNIPLVHRIAREMEKGGDDLGLPTPVGIEYHPHNWGEGTVLK